MTLVKSNRNGNRDAFPRLVNNFFNRDFFNRAPMNLDESFFDLDRQLVPSVNVLENNKDFRIEMAVPGLEKKDFKIEVNNGTLTVSAEKKQESKNEDENYCRQEFSYHSFSRSFSLPANSIPDKIEAHYGDGILKLVLPKKETTVARPVKEIKVE